VKLKDIPEYESFAYAYGTFLDEFRKSADKPDLLSDRPDKGDRLTQAILAATAHKLANDYNLDVPDWVFDGWYYMSEPVFAFSTKNPDYQKLLLEITPIEFASRNIFCGDNVMNRV